jgi:hypothetical protein
MSWEGLWYSMYSENGGQPKCRRLNRFSTDIQWNSAVDIAIAVVQGNAGSRSIFRRLNIGYMQIVEGYWYWPNPLDQPEDTGWWLIPERIERRVRELIDAAIQCEIHRNGGWCEDEDIVRCLRSWRKTKQWRRYISRGRVALDSIGEGYGAWYQATFTPRRRRTKKLAA